MDKLKEGSDAKTIGFVNNSLILNNSFLIFKRTIIK